jgi:hypothetical protein
MSGRQSRRAVVCNNEITHQFGGIAESLQPVAYARRYGAPREGHTQLFKSGEFVGRENIIDNRHEVLPRFPDKRH